jgi:hypothetical protein
VNRTELLKRVGTIMLRTPSLWVVTLIGVLIEAVVGYALREPSLGMVLIQTAVVFIITAFTTGALIGLVQLAAKQEPASIGAGIRSGLANLPPLLIVSVLLAVPVWIALSVYFYSTGGSITEVILSGMGQPNGLQLGDLLNNLPALLSLVGVIFATGILMHAIGVGAERAIVVDQESILVAFKQGYTLLRTKIVDFVTWAMILAVAILSLQLITGLLLSQMIGAPNLDQNFLGGTLVTLNVVTGAIITVLISTVWTLVYLEWQNPTPVEIVPDEKHVSKKKG